MIHYTHEEDEDQKKKRLKNNEQAQKDHERFERTQNKDSSKTPKEIPRKA